jgi:hypothetical protein
MVPKVIYLIGIWFEMYLAIVGEWKRGNDSSLIIIAVVLLIIV